MGAGRGGDEGKFSAAAAHSHEKLQTSLSLSLRVCALINPNRHLCLQSTPKLLPLKQVMHCGMSSDHSLPAVFSEMHAFFFIEEEGMVPMKDPILI